MALAGIIIMAFGSIGVFAAVGMEIWKKETIYMMFMKIFALMFGIGGVLFGLE